MAREKTPAPKTSTCLVDNFDRDPGSLTLGHRTHQRTDLLGDTTLAADHLTHVRGSYVELQHDLAFAIDLVYRYLFGMFDQTLCDISEQFLYVAPP